MQTNTITIAGLGRTGVSIALALKEGQLDFTVIGYDGSDELLRDPLVAGAVTRVEANLVRACEQADIVVVTVPSVELEETLQRIGDRIQDHTLIIDLTALKAPGLKLARKYVTRGHYVGARPIFGASTFTDLRANSYAARSDLFRNSVFCVMPAADTDPDAVETAVRFGQLLGAVPYFVDPLEYDQLSLGVDTMPGASAAALLRSITQTSGWRDILRFADLPFAIGTLPLESNPDELAHQLLNDRQATVRWLDGLIGELKELRRFVEEGEPELLAAYLAELNATREAWLQERSTNEWDEAKTEDVELPTFREHFLGGLAGRRKDRD